MYFPSIIFFKVSHLYKWIIYIKKKKKKILIFFTFLILVWLMNFNHQINFLYLFNNLNFVPRWQMRYGGTKYSFFRKIRQFSCLNTSPNFPDYFLMYFPSITWFSLKYKIYFQNCPHSFILNVLNSKIKCFKCPKSYIFFPPQ